MPQCETNKVHVNHNIQSIILIATEGYKFSTDLCQIEFGIHLRHYFLDDFDDFDF